MDPTALMNISMPMMLLILAWTLPWKGVALWKAAKNGHKIWFVVLLVLNTLAILEILYIFYFSKKKTAQGTSAPSNPTA
jgi:hypothetical protein